MSCEAAGQQLSSIVVVIIVMVVIVIIVIVVIVIVGIVMVDNSGGVSDCRLTCAWAIPDTSAQT